MGGNNTPCASCKLLRRRCGRDCVFAPYFPSDQPHKFAIVHKVFGASNVSKMLQELPHHQRADAVSSLVYEANARIKDPVYGCVGAISYLQNQVAELQMQLAVAQAEILCIKMKQEQAMTQPQKVMDLEDPEFEDKPFLIHSDLTHELFSSFGSNTIAIPSINFVDHHHDSLKKGSIGSWTRNIEMS